MSSKIMVKSWHAQQKYDKELKFPAKVWRGVEVSSKNYDEELKCPAKV